MTGPAGAEIRALHRAGQRRWPSLSVHFETFAEHCRRVFATAGGAAIEAGDLYLCCACIAGQPAALEAFENENVAAAEAAIRRITADDDFVHDALQELWKRLLLGNEAKLRSYSARGPLQAWVRVAATRVALDRRRATKRHARREVALSDTLVACDSSAEAKLLRARFGQAFQVALRQAIGRLSERERNVLRMHVLGRCSIDEIGVAYGVHRATAARWIERARTNIYDQVRHELCAGHKLTVSEFHSLATLLGAEVELDLASERAYGAVGDREQRGDVA